MKLLDPPLPLDSAYSSPSMGRRGWLRVELTPRLELPLLRQELGKLAHSFLDSRYHSFPELLTSDDLMEGTG